MPGPSEDHDRTLTIATGLAAFLLILLGTLVEWRSLLNNDVGWLLHVAERVLAGDVLYRDVIEINPPLIVWLNLPLAWLTLQTHLPKVAVVRIAVLLVMLGSVTLVTLLVRFSRLLPRHRTVLLAVLVLVTFPFAYFGQREHLILALMLPWFLVAMCSMAGEKLPSWARTVTGLLLGIAISLKPHYILAWLLPLGYVAWVRRSTAVLRSSEQLAAAATIAGYAVSVLLVTPEYLELVRRMGAAYLQWLPETVRTMLLGNPGGIAAMGILLVYILARRGRPATDVLALGLVGFLIGVLLQKRGSDYHYYPAVGLGLILLGLTASQGPRARRLAGVGFGILAGTLLFIAGSQAFGSEAGEMGDYRELRRALSPVDTTTSLLSLSPRGGLPFELVNHAGAKWALRFPFPIVPALIYSRQLDAGAPIVYHPPAERPPLEQWFVNTVLDDAERLRPSIILIHIPSTSVDGRDLRMDFAAYFSVEPRFRELLTHYRYTGQAEGFRIYRRLPGGG
jgi:hypothetical protein